MAVDRTVDHVDFVLEHATGWSIYLYLGLLLLLGWWAWARYGPTPAGASGFVTRLARLLAIVAVVALLTGPAWRRTRTSTIPGKLVVAIDTSPSMARTDGPGGAERIAVARQLVAAIDRYRQTHDLEVAYYRLGRGATPLDPAAAATVTADGTGSPLGRELEEILTTTSLDLLVVVSDFRVTDGSSLGVLAAQLHQRNLPAYLLPVGSTAIDPELQLIKVDGPTELPLDEHQPFTLRIVHRNLTGDRIIVRVRCRGEVLDEKILPVTRPADPTEQVDLAVDLAVTLHAEGEHPLEFSAEQDGVVGKPIRRTVTASQRRLRVLLLDWGPRWEACYLREALLRDPTITVHCYLAEGLWRRWGDLGPTTIPLDLAVLRDYDAIILGDIPVDAQLRDQLDDLEKAVRQHGSGLIWLPGEYGHTATFKDTSIGDLLPVTLPSAEAIAAGYAGNRETTLHRAEAAELLGLLDSGGVAWSELPKLRGICPMRTADVKPNARVLLQTDTGDPAVVHAPYGNGAALLIGVDDTWRWRRHVGDTYLHRFWSQLLRFVAAGRGLGQRQWRGQCNPYLAVPGAPVVLAVVPNGPLRQAVDLPPEVVVRLGEGGKQDLLVPLSLAPDDTTYRGTVPAPTEGTWTMELVSGLPPEQVQSAELVVVPPRRELRDPRVDLPAATELAETSGGAIFTDPANLLAKLPDRSRTESTPTMEPLWDRWWILVLLVAALALEWSLRRLNRLP
jgi:hypothetical protein